MRKYVVLTVAVLTMALAAMAVVAAEKKIKEKAKPKPKAAEEATPCGCAAGTQQEATGDTLCLAYKVADYGSYCLWYALHLGCMTPAPYYGTCYPTLPQNCNTGANCFTTAKLTRVGVGKEHSVWGDNLPTAGLKAPPHPTANPREGVITTEAYIEFFPDAGASAGTPLFAKIFQVRMIPEKFKPNPPGEPLKPEDMKHATEIEDGHGFQVKTIPAGATVFSAAKNEVITVKRAAPFLVTVFVHVRGNEYRAYNILLDGTQGAAKPAEAPKAKRKRDRP